MGHGFHSYVSLLRSLLEPDFGTFVAPGPAIKSEAFLEPDFGTFAAPGPAIKLLV